jgi:hypothetical protein
MILSHNLHENLLAFLLWTPLSLDEYVSKLKTVKTKVMETNVVHTSYSMHFLRTLCDLERRDANAIISILFVTLYSQRETPPDRQVFFMLFAPFIVIKIVQYKQTNCTFVKLII